MFDAVTAWAELAEKVESREGWGSDRLLAEMRKLETRHAITEGLLQRVMRLYPGQLKLVAINPAEVMPAGEVGAAPSSAEADAAPPIGPEEDHDGREHAAGHGSGNGNGNRAV